MYPVLKIRGRKEQRNKRKNAVGEDEHENEVDVTTLVGSTMPVLVVDILIRETVAESVFYDKHRPSSSKKLLFHFALAIKELLPSFHYTGPVKNRERVEQARRIQVSEMESPAWPGQKSMLFTLRAILLSYYYGDDKMNTISPLKCTVTWRQHEVGKAMNTNKHKKLILLLQTLVLCSCRSLH